MVPDDHINVYHIFLDSHVDLVDRILCSWKDYVRILVSQRMGEAECSLYLCIQRCQRERLFCGWIQERRTQLKPGTVHLHSNTCIK